VTDKMKLTIDRMQVISSRGNNKNVMYLFLSCVSVYLRGLSSAGMCHYVVGRIAAGDKALYSFKKLVTTCPTTRHIFLLISNHKILSKCADCICCYWSCCM